MKILQKNFADRDAFLPASEEMLSTKGYLATHAESVDAREAVKFQLMHGTKVVAELEAEAVYVAPTPGGFQVGLEFKGKWRENLAEAQKAWPEKSDEEEGMVKYGKDANSIHHAIMNMTPNEKIQAALKGGKEERRILLKDAHYAVHAYILKNPKITTEEVAQISRMGNVTGEMIRIITHNTEWMGNAAVRLAIVKNSKTPIPVVDKQIGKLGDTELIQIAKSEGTREAVAKLATRVLATRGKKVR